MNKSALKILRDFDAAAPHYDHAAALQAETAARLVDWARIEHAPADILDIGSGTGFVAEAASRKWPRAAVTALDHAPAMLAQAQMKMPHLKIVAADAAHAEMAPRFDIIFSSMMLHWLPDPVAALKRWQNWLKPDGRLFVALLTAGSFKEWDNLCRSNNLDNGLWPMPHDDVAGTLTARRELQNVRVLYPSARDFLRRLKTIGAATPRHNHKPLSPGVLRHILACAPQPFAVTYRILYAEIKSAATADN